MNVFVQIIVNIIFPVFALIGVGLFAHRKFKFDLQTLSKLTTFILMPAVSFANLYESRVEWGLFGQVAGYLIILSLSLIAVSTVFFRLNNMDGKSAAVFKNNVVLINSGNFGLPVSQLVFQHQPVGMAVQVIISVYQNLLTYSYGMLNSVSADRGGGWRAITAFLKIPTLYAVLLGLLLNTWNVELPDYLWKPIENVSDAFLALALFTLGAQSAALRIRPIPSLLVFSMVGRLLVSPILAYLLIRLLGMEGVVAQACFIASAFPTSRNASLLALEHDNHPDLAAKAVILSTFLSSVTVSVVIYSSQLLFG
ncbi:AEC family transporter [Paenibacillus methanolicus]|uniref:Transporter n=1 Tax=Paenibacillus methanolicus TaxID=582686 RepID=A0A5S5CJL4_9BACL|nr:AEC family transporter [Paenibacillus methanolicus]TYP79704.1 hypothetical protein BCM02_101825 [Paenibacillus methanolicus]